MMMISLCWLMEMNGYYYYHHKIWRCTIIIWVCVRECSARTAKCTVVKWMKWITPEKNKKERKFVLYYRHMHVNHDFLHYYSNKISFAYLWIVNNTIVHLWYIWVIYKRWNVGVRRYYYYISKRIIVCVTVSTR